MLAEGSRLGAPALQILTILPASVNEGLYPLPGHTGWSVMVSHSRNHGDKRTCGNNKQLIKIGGAADEMISPVICVKCRKSNRPSVW